MNTIEETKNGSLSSSAKLVAASAETMKVSNETLGIEEEIKCSDIVELNEEDYAMCNIEFDENGSARVTIVGKGKFLGKYVCGGTKNNALVTKECDVLIPVDILQEIYDFKYYDSLYNAVTDVNNNEIGLNAIDSKDDAGVGVYSYDGNTSVVLLNDITENERVDVYVDMTINLGGKTLTSNTKVAINVFSGNVNIDGRLDGSVIQVTDTVGNVARPIQIMDGDVFVNGGTYISNSNNANGSCITSLGNLVVRDAIIITNETGSKVARGIGNGDGANLSIYNSDISVTSTNGRSMGVYNSGTVSITNSNIRALSNYNSDGTMSARGIENHSDITINNSTVFGVFSGIYNNGNLQINGGIYEGYSRGGIYFLGDGTSFVADAEIKEASMPDGYTSELQSEKIGMQIKSSSGLSIYMNNCDIYGSEYSLILGDSEDVVNNLYMSNSNINGNIRIDNSINIIYIGKGNNFTSANTNLESSVVITDEVYISD